MNAKSFFLCISLLLTIIFTVPGCDDGGGSGGGNKNVLVTSVQINEGPSRIITGNREQFEATVYPSNASNKNITWSSSNESVATIGEDGIVTTLTEGNTIIGVTTEDGNFTDQYAITVTNYMCVAAGIEGLKIYNAADPTNPVVAGSYDTGGSAEAVSVSGSHAYMIDGSSDLMVIDISNPGDPQLATAFGLGSQAYGLAVKGNYAYVAVQGNKLLIIDISIPDAPELVGTYTSDRPVYDVTVHGNYAYLTRNREGIEIVDISVPETPGREGLLDTATTSEEYTYVKVRGNYAYVSNTYGRTWLIVNVSNPSSPSVVNTYEDVYRIRGVWFRGNYAYLSDGLYGLRILDMTDPVNPASVGLCYTKGMSSSVHVSGHYAYMASSSAGFTIIDFEQNTDPVIVGSDNVACTTNDLDINGNYAYLSELDNGIAVVDISNPASPVRLSDFRTHVESMGVCFNGNYVYVADYSGGITRVNVGDPVNPTHGGNVLTHGNAWNVTVSGDFAYAAEWWNGFTIIDLYQENWVNPYYMTYVGSYDTAVNPETTDNYGYDVCVNGNYAFVAARSAGVVVFDITNPMACTKYMTIDTPGQASGIEISGNYAFVADDSEGLYIVNISSLNPSSPPVGTSYNPTTSSLFTCGEVDISGNYAFISEDSPYCLYIIDISVPSSPSLVTSYTTNSLVQKVKVVGNYAYLAQSWTGLVILDVTDMSSPSVVFEEGSCLGIE